jgi:hypothetical protein
VDRELGRNLSLSVAYVGSAGRRLPSSIAPINAINPSYLSMGERSTTSSRRARRVWTACRARTPAGRSSYRQRLPPSVAQALQPYPAVLRTLQGLNETTARRTTTRCR